MNPASLLYAIPLPCALYRTVADTRSRQMEYSCIDCNEALAELLGKNCRDIIGRTPSELIPGIGKDMEDWLHICARVAESGVSEELEYYSPTFETWFRIHVFSTGEDEVGIILQDIHAQKKMEEAAVLHKQHELLASQSKDILYRYQLGPEPGYTYVSPSAAEITGYTPEEFYRDPQIAYKLVHPDDEQHLKELSENGIDNIEPLCLRWLHKDGATIWMELRLIIERDNSGAAAAIHGLARDITESRLTEISLRDSRLELSQILSAVSDMVVYYNSTDMRIVWANQAAEESAGAEPGGLIGRTCHSIWSSNPGEPCSACPIIRCFHTHTKQSGEHTTRAGETWIIHAYPVISTTGTFIGVVETARDITYRIRIEDELQSALDHADTANMVKDQFIANMNHELRTPLNGIIGITELLLAASGIPEEQYELLQLIEESGYRMLDIVQEILSFSRLTTDSLEEQYIRFNLRSVIDSIIEPHQRTAEEKALSFSITYHTTGLDWVLGYPGKIRQMLGHILHNAVKFTRHGSVHITVEAHSPDTEPSGQDEIELRFIVRDTGIGMNEEDRLHATESFYQAESGFTRSFGGVGLGLTIAHRQAKEMNGDLQISSVPGRGTTVMCRVRCRRLDTPATGEFVPLSPQQLEGAPQFPAYRILVIEDDSINRRFLSTSLTRMGCSPDVAENGADAKPLLATEDYDLILMDIQMPVMNGIETARYIRDSQSDVRNHDVHIIAVSAYIDPEEKKQCSRVGINEFLEKPITIARLKHHIWRLATAG